MKLWRKGENLVIELEAEQNEILRLAYILKIGASAHREEQRKLYATQGDLAVKSAISGYLISLALEAYLVGSNYTGFHGTEDNPAIKHINSLINSTIDSGYNLGDWNERELEVMKKYSWRDIIGKQDEEVSS